MVDFQDFAEYAKAAVTEKLSNEYESVEARIINLKRFNGISYNALATRLNDSDKSVLVNLDLHYGKFKRRTADLGTIVNDMVEYVKNNIKDAELFPVIDFEDYESIKSKLEVRLIPEYENRELLKEIVYKKMEDLAVVYRIKDKMADGRIISCTINNKMLDKYGISAEQLHKDAISASLRRDGFEIDYIENVLRKILRQSNMNVEIPTDPDVTVYVLQSKCGAAGILFDGAMDEVARIVGGDYYILPSSVDDLIFIPDDGKFEREYLEEVVGEVNRFYVPKKEFLSNCPDIIKL